MEVLTKNNPFRLNLREKIVARKVQGILTRNEQILIIGVPKGILRRRRRCLILTNRRFIIFSSTWITGSANFEDHQWLDLEDARLKEGWRSASLTLQTTKGQELTVNRLPKNSARKLYACAQEHEERSREVRREREIEDKRADAGGVVVKTSASPPASVPATAPATEDPAEKLQKLKGMLEAGLITAEEFEAKRADILSKM